MPNLRNSHKKKRPELGKKLSRTPAAKKNSPLGPRGIMVPSAPGRVTPLISGVPSFT